MRTVEKTLSLPAHVVRELNGILNSTKHYPKADRDGVIEEFVAHFDGGDFMALIKVCNGDGPYVDPVLFAGEHDGNFMQYHEISTMEVQDLINGTYWWEVKDKFHKPVKIILNVVAVEGLDKGTYS